MNFETLYAYLLLEWPSNFKSKLLLYCTTIFQFHIQKHFNMLIFFEKLNMDFKKNILVLTAEKSFSMELAISCFWKYLLQYLSENHRCINLKNEKLTSKHAMLYFFFLLDFKCQIGEKKVQIYSEIPNELVAKRFNSLTNRKSIYIKI